MRRRHNSFYTFCRNLNPIEVLYGIAFDSKEPTIVSESTELLRNPILLSIVYKTSEDSDPVNHTLQNPDASPTAMPARPWQTHR